MFRNRFIRWTFMIAVGFAIGSAIGYMEAQKEIQELEEVYGEPGEQNAASILRTTNTTFDIGGEFELVNQDGETVTQENYKDTYKLVFFGFTYCPAICPTELQKLNLVLTDLGPMAEQFTPIFISVDPERDTPRS